MLPNPKAFTPSWATFILFGRVRLCSRREPRARRAPEGRNPTTSVVLVREAACRAIHEGEGCDKDWAELADALHDYVDLRSDERFASGESRRAHDEALRNCLASVFAKETARRWESAMTERDIGCVQVHTETPYRQIQLVEGLIAEYTAGATSPVFDEHRRLAPLVRFSRSTTDARGGCLAGQHTSAVLREFGYSQAELDDLRAESIIAGD